ncbi:MAG TPA: DUF488 family protein [Thermoplasmata archaeon]|jgi:uncharacterized protein YeaO (DUF488 family)|nr:DUF488 family protein [Thermoplasmata archaeon]
MPLEDDRIRTKHVSDPPHPSDGRRHLVEREWPEKVAREAAKIDSVLDRLAPSPTLKAWHERELEKFEEFSLKFRMELIGADQELDKLIDEAEHGPVTLVHAGEKTAKSHAHVLADVLRERFAAKRSGARRSGEPEPGSSPRAP